MALGKGRVKLFLSQNECLQSRRMMRQYRPSQTDGEASMGNHFPDTFGSTFLKDNGDTWITTAEFFDDSSQKRLRRRADVAEPQFALFSSGSPLHAARGFVKAL